MLEIKSYSSKLKIIRKPRNIFLVVLTFLLFFFLPVGWSKHWIIPQSFVNGVLMDYLMPAVWLQDLLVLAFIIAYLIFGVVSFRVRFPVIPNPPAGGEESRPKAVFTLCQVRLGFRMTEVIGLLLVFIPIFFSSIPLISAIYTARFLLALTGGYLLIRVLKTKGKDSQKIKNAALAGFNGAAIWTGMLAILQFVKQKTVFGWGFLGEPVFNAGYTGVKKVELFGKLLVAPMATFPHSNVLAGFALLSIIVLSGYRHAEFSSASKIQTRGILKRVQNDAFYRLAIALSTVSLILSFSVYTWIVGVVMLLNCYVAKLFKTRKFLHVTLSFFILIFTLLVSFNSYIPKFLNSLSVVRRLDLAKVSLSIIKDRPLFGVGYGCFVSKLPEYWLKIGTIGRFLQPAHNYFLIMFSEVGLVGSLGIILLVSRIYCGVIKRNFLLLATCYLLLFLFDHYFWTTTQGIYMMFWLPVFFANKNPLDLKN